MAAHRMMGRRVRIYPTSNATAAVASFSAIVIFGILMCAILQFGQNIVPTRRTQQVDETNVRPKSNVTQAAKKTMCVCVCVQPTKKRWRKTKKKNFNFMLLEWNGMG